VLTLTASLKGCQSATGSVFDWQSSTGSQKNWQYWLAVKKSRIQYIKIVIFMSHIQISTPLSVPVWVIFSANFLLL
jgi:hypothetical protein